MTAGDPGPGVPAEILFANGNRALLVNGPGAGPDGLLGALGLPPGGGGGVILVCGGADDLTGEALNRAQEVLGPAVSAAAQVTGAVVLDGGTSSGVMAVTGAARGRQPRAMPVLAGVAPAGLVSYPGGPSGGDRVPLEANHSHFFLADSSEWGGETGLLMGLAGTCAAGGRVVVVTAGGGQVAKAEVLESVRRGWPVFVIRKTGGLADDIARLWEAHRVAHRRPGGWLWPAKYRYRQRPPLSSIPDPDLREVVSEGDIRLVTTDEPGQLARQVAWELQDEPVLKSAWQQFATYDRLAARLRKAFTRFQAWILLLGVLATLLGLIQAQVGNSVLHWVVVTVPLVAAILVAVAGRRAVAQRWVALRAAAEAIKAEIFRYRALPASRARGAGHDQRAGRQRELAAHLEHIETGLMHTDASSGPLTPYTGPLPPQMYGAGRDDDGLSPLDAGRYLQIRIADQLSYFHGRIRSLSRRRNAFQFLVIAAGAAGALLAAAGLEAWIGLTSGGAAALLAYLGYLQVDNTIVTYNQAATKLAALDRGWHARAPAQRTAAAFRDLVTQGEAVLTREQAGWVQQMSDTIQELQRKQAEAAKSIEPAATARPPESTTGSQP